MRTSHGIPHTRPHVGKRAAALYRARHGENPPKHKQFVNGRDILETAIDDVVL